MRELFFKIFAKSYFNTGIKITAFSLSHIIYAILIAGSIISLYYAFRNKSAEKKERLMRFLAYAIVISYLSDFFFHDFVYGGLKMDKLPFHVCTALCPIVAITQFNRNGKKLMDFVVMLSIVAPLMYLTYPASVGSGEPWCYQAVQTMFFHGTLMAWGILNVALNIYKPNIKTSWKSLILLIAITIWAKFGNLLLEHNWFFLEEDAFYIGLVEKGIIQKWVLMIANPVAFYSVVLMVYGIYYGVIKLKEKYNGKNV